MTDAPLAISGGSPILFGALGAVFHLEELVPDDEERLERACDLLWSWFGAELRWSALSCYEGMEPARRSHLEYISTYASHLDAEETDDENAQHFSNNLTKHGRTDYYVVTHGGEDPDMASPFSVRFWAEIGDVPEDDYALPAYSVLHFTVPESWPVADFHAKVCAIAAELRLRWGAAGYTYSPQELTPGRDAERALYAHARRHVGYDVPAYVQHTDRFFKRVRSVNWLTFLGEDIARDIGAPLIASPPVEVFDIQGSTLLRAGPRPERGDINRLWVPPAYQRADELVRPIRERGGDIDFFHPWDERTTAAWLRRFERLTIGSA